MSQTPPSISIPSDLLPGDGRFGAGPSKVRPEAIDALASAAPHYMGTSHRQPMVKDMVGRLRGGIADLFGLPDDWEVVLGNGGTTLFWDAATFGLVDAKSQHLVFGEFSSKFAACTAAAPFLADPVVINSDTGTHPVAVAAEGIDLYALTHNETSTGVAMNLTRPSGSGDAIVAVDATSAAGGLRWDPSEVDCYYFAPQKAFASDGGLWIACCSPAAQDRIAQIGSGSRWIPPGLDLTIALDNSKLNQTYNTPSLATIFLAVQQVEWFNTNGGMDFSAGRCDASAEVLYGWAERASYTSPFVAEASERSHVIGTIDIDDAIDAVTISKVLRANGVIDTESYRKLGRNQLRIAMFPSVDPADVEALTKSIDYVAEQLS